jgi:two-component system, OmpR family, sensor kinase
VLNGEQAVPGLMLATLKARFARGRTGARGSGLDLAGAETIAAGVAARLDLISPVTGRPDGFEAILHLPAASAAHNGKSQAP